MGNAQKKGVDATVAAVSNAPVQSNQPNSTSSPSVAPKPELDQPLAENSSMIV